jgi:MFS transporter, NNP family, nitrate/nitrite transporter
MSAGSLVEIGSGDRWTAVCAYDDLLPGRGVAVLLDGEQIALFRDRAGAVYAVRNHDPFSDAHVISRGIMGSRGDVPVVASPMYKHAFSLRTGECLDERTTPDGSPARLRIWPVRLAPAEPRQREAPLGQREAPLRRGEAPRPRKRSIDDWRPEDPGFWARTGARVARRNLVHSVLTEHIGFSVWSLWSALVLFLGPAYGIDPAGKFTLTAVPTLVGSVLRLPYTWAVARFGGRNWTVFSALLLLVPTAATAVLLRPGVPYGTLLALAAVAGVGGGNFASSMANINAFYPQHLKGRALGVNAGGGNLGVAAVQLVALLILATAGAAHPWLLPAVYLPLIVLAALGAAWRMNNLPAVRGDRSAMREAVRDRHTWLISLLYIGTFGSFIGFGFAFGQVLQVQFHQQFDTPLKAAYLTFLGPLVGSLARPLGGWLADRLGGARVTLWTFAAMAAGALTVLLASRRESLPLFLAGFVVLFLLSGVGNGSTYKMIPAVFLAGSGTAEPAAGARRRASAVIGLAGAIGAFGGVLVNLAFRQTFLTAHTGDLAYAAFVGYYVLCLAVTWTAYRRPAARRRLPGV